MKVPKTLLPVSMLLLASVVIGQAKKTLPAIENGANLTQSGVGILTPAKKTGNKKPNIVFGRVTDKLNRPLANLVVRVYDRDLRSEVLLGETVTNSEGNYEVTWDNTQLTGRNRRAANISIKVLTREKKTLLFVSGNDLIRYNASAKEEINVVIETEVKQKAR